MSKMNTNFQDDQLKKMEDLDADYWYSQENQDEDGYIVPVVHCIDTKGKTTTRPLTPEEEAQFESDFMQELESDHDGDEE